ncbi:MarR family winged helix-turn-helix transcriptional regulator [Pseudomonas sp. BF-R-26]|uniref:MarR family winged helix-turn-helix transcriptional regulator n=1 Tax=Pseudomonas sp. BF-R-26 TaxID=2832398 RepID=UPI001CBCD340|nr:MarR family transcriptional regulator [Pseudomonas sp. BF-R-26]
MSESLLSLAPDQSAPYLGDASWKQCDNAYFLVRLALSSLNRMLDQEMAPLGLTAGQWRPIIMVWNGRAATAGELALLNNVNTGAMTRTLDRLEAKGLLRRMRSNEDRRVIRIELTEAGSDTAKRIPAGIGRVLAQHLRGFTADEESLFKDFMWRMLANGSTSSTESTVANTTAS